MKKYAPLLFALIIAASVLPASAASINPGFRLGLNFSNTTKIAGEPAWQVKTGFCSGGLLSFNLSDFFAIEPQLLLSWKGAQIHEEDDQHVLDRIINLFYLDIPILAKVTIPFDSKFRPFLFAGPYFGLKLSATYREMLDTAQGTYDQDTKLTTVKSWDSGLVYGGGLQVTVGGGQTFNVEGRYAESRSSIYSSGPGKKLKVVSILIGVSF